MMLWLLRTLLTRADAEALLGDALEELQQRTAAGRKPRWTRLWLNWQMVRALAAAVPARAPRGLRALGYIVRDAARSVRRTPAHPLFVVAILTVGISAATVTFSIVDAVVLQPLPIERSEELVMVRGQTAKGLTNLTPAEFWAVHDQVNGFDSFATMLQQSFVKVSAGGTDSRGIVLLSTAELFRVLKVEPSMGRVWTAEEEAQVESNLALISDRIWRSRFGAAPDVLGRTVGLDGKPRQIIGVMPAGAEFDEIGWSIDAWIPGAPSRGGEPGGRRASGIGRVRGGVSIEQLQAQVQSALASTAALPPGNADWRPAISRWDRELTTGRTDMQRWLLLALAVVGLVMLIACVNAANVMLIRSVERAHELAIRASLGASRRSLTLSLLTESVMLSAIAAAAGITVSAWASQVARTAISALPVGAFVHGRLLATGLNGRVLMAAILAALVTGLLFGAVPAWQASRASVVSVLKDASSTVTAGRRRWRSAFLAAEIACVAVLLVIATLFITTFVRVTSLDLGIDRSNLLAVNTVTEYQGTAQEVKDRFARIPGVSGVAAATYSSLPLVGQAFGGAWGSMKLEPVGDAPGATPAEATISRVTADYFSVAGMPFRQGSTWSSGDQPGFRPMVVDELAARRLVATGSAVGLQVRATGLKGSDVFTIVGVVPHVFARGPDYPDFATAYYAMRPNEKPSWVSFLVRTTVPPASLVPTVEGVLQEIAGPSDSPGAGVLLPDDAFNRMTIARRFNAGLMSILAVVVILISAAGIYAVMASVVAKQTREIGVRVALGATASDIRRRVLAQASRHVLIGLAAGLPVAWWLSRGFASFFYGVSPANVSIYVVVTVVLVSVGLVAAFVPARRASRVDPVVSLRAS
jgi:putative ABC transport system permease protein